MLLLYSHNQLYIRICRQKHNDTIRTSKDSSLEKYTSHFIWKGSKGLLNVLLCERWVGDRTELQHIDPHSYGHNSISFPFSWSAQPGAWGPNLFGTWFSFQHLLSNSSEALNSNCSIWVPEGPLCWVLLRSTASYLQLIWNSCHRGYIIIWRSLFFLRASQFRTQFNPSTVKVTPDLLISSTGCACYLHRYISSFDSLAGSEVNMQHFQWSLSKVPHSKWIVFQNEAWRICHHFKTFKSTASMYELSLYPFTLHKWF